MQDILSFLQAHWALTLALAIILMLLTLLEYFKANKMNQLTPLQLTQLINRQHAVLLDLRSADLFSNGHIIDAISLPLSDLNNKIKKIEKFKTQPLVLISTNDTESKQASTLLRKNGFQQIYTLAGGIRTWKTADMPLVKG